MIFFKLKKIINYSPKTSLWQKNSFEAQATIKIVQMVPNRAKYHIMI